MDMIECSNCNNRVQPKPDGACPICQAVIPHRDGVVDIPPAEPSTGQAAVEVFTYQKFFKTILLIRAGVYVLFALVMFGVGFFLVFPSGGRIIFGGLGWLFFLLSPAAAFAGMLQYQKATAYSVELSNKGIRVGKIGADWGVIVKMESHMTLKDMATGEQTAIRLTTRQGRILILPAATKNLPYIKKYIEDHAKNLK